MTTATLLNHLYHCGICEQVTAFYEIWKHHRNCVRGAALLEDMNDYQLKDIGLTRGDIPAVRRGLIRGSHYRSML